MSAWTIVERSTTWLRDFEPAWLPESASAYLRVFTRANGDVGVEVGPWVGAVALENGSVLRVRSKFGEADFLRMLAKSTGVSLKFGGDVAYGDSGADAPMAVIARSFVESLRDIEGQGRLFNWRTTPYVGASRPRGVNWPRTARRVALKSSEPFVGDMLERSVDSPEERVLRLAATRLIAEARDLELDPGVLDRWRSTELGDPRSDLRAISERLATPGYYSARGYYESALRLATMLLGLGGLTEETEADISGRAFLVDSDNLFEAYIRATLFESMRDDGYVVEKARPGELHLFDNRRSSMEPDILVSRGSALVALGDIKHKEPDQSDYYQLYAYMRLYGLEKSFVFYAAADPGRSETTSKTRDGLALTFVPLPIADLDELELRVSTFASKIKQ